MANWPVFFVISIILGMMIFANTYVQTSAFVEEKLVASVEIIVRNSDDQLVTYLESDRLTIMDKNSLNQLLDSVASEIDPIIIRNGAQFQIIKRGDDFVSESYKVISTTKLKNSLSGKPIVVAGFAHDGISTEPGDKVTSIWTFIRPVN